MTCDRCKEPFESWETTYTVQYEDSPHPEDICESCLDKDGELFTFIELGYQLHVSIP